MAPCVLSSLCPSRLPSLTRLTLFRNPQMFESETSRIIRSAPALAPVPKRQPIGDSFFPSLVVDKAPLVDGVEEKEEEAAVDLVSEIWGF